MTMVVLLISCAMKTVRLQDGRTKVPALSKVYKHRQTPDPIVFARIDTNCLYWRVSPVDNSLIVIYRFYSNGTLNCFAFLAKSSVDLSKELDPEYNGYRGIYYLKDDELKCDLFVPNSGLGHKELGKEVSTFRIKGDTLFEFRKASPEYPGIYLKGRLPEEVAHFQPSW